MMELGRMTHRSLTIEELTREHEENVKAALDHWKWHLEFYIRDCGLNGVVVREDGTEGRLECLIQGAKVVVAFYEYDEQGNQKKNPTEIVDSNCDLTKKFKEWEA